jgi:nucleoside 2-deoxyribosyltransferase
MWFDTQMNSAWEKGLKTAIKNCGYDPERVCDRPHNSDICDEIIACIKNAKFVVADFTGNRGGVYYEAGFAHGLGKQVILTCRKDWFEGKTEGKDDEKIHFDLNHHNFIIWDDPDDLAQQLTWRIKATI